MGRDTYKNRIELIQGTLDMLILSTLQWGAQHGYGISQSIRNNSGQPGLFDIAADEFTDCRLHDRGVVSNQMQLPHKRSTHFTTNLFIRDWYQEFRSFSRHLALSTPYNRVELIDEVVPLYPRGLVQLPR